MTWLILWGVCTSDCFLLLLLLVSDFFHLEFSMKAAGELSRRRKGRRFFFPRSSSCCFQKESRGIESSNAPSARRSSFCLEGGNAREEAATATDEEKGEQNSLRFEKEKVPPPLRRVSVFEFSFSSRFFHLQKKVFFSFSARVRMFLLLFSSDFW
jgi:hypothetical protein